MGLIKTGLTLAGGYGLIKAASKAANDHEEKKYRRQNPPEQTHNAYYEPHMGYMYNNNNQMNNPHAPYGPQSYGPGPQGNYGNNMYQHPAPQSQSRSIDPSQMGHSKPMDNPPPYQSQPFEMQGHAQHGSAEKYYHPN